MPLRHRLVSLPHAEQSRLVERPADYLHSDRQARIREATRNRKRRQTRQRSRDSCTAAARCPASLGSTRPACRLKPQSSARLRGPSADMMTSYSFQRRVQFAPYQFPRPLRTQVCPGRRECCRFQSRACTPVVVYGVCVLSHSEWYAAQSTSATPMNTAPLFSHVGSDISSAVAPCSPSTLTARITDSRTSASSPS